jgi:site-specific DNA recombinase
MAGSANISITAARTTSRTPNIPNVRWIATDLEQAVIEELGRLKIPTPEIAEWFRHALSAAFSDITEHQRRQSAVLAKRRSELANMQERLLNAYLGGTVEEPAFKAKTVDLKGEAARIDETLAQLGNVDPTCGEAALAVFDWAQNAAETWRGSSPAQCASE